MTLGDRGSDRLSVNGEPRSVASRDVAGLLEELGYSPDRRAIAVAVNGELVPRSTWSSHSLHPGD